MAVCWLTVDQVGSELGISRRTVYALIRLGKLEAVKIEKAYRIAQSALDDYLERARVISQPAVRVPLRPSRPVRRRQSRTAGVELNVPGADFFVKRRREGAH